LSEVVLDRPLQGNKFKLSHFPHLLVAIWILPDLPDSIISSEYIQK